MPYHQLIRVVALAAILVNTAMAGPVRVAIWEGLPDSWDWKRLSSMAEEVYETPALGFVQLPAKMNERGIEVDRVVPFALHAETTLTVAEGKYRLILRSKGASRVAIDGNVVVETPDIISNSAGHEPVPEPAPPEDVRQREVAAGDQGARPATVPEDHRR